MSSREDIMVDLLILELEYNPKTDELENKKSVENDYINLMASALGSEKARVGNDWKQPQSSQYHCNGTSLHPSVHFSESIINQSLQFQAKMEKKQPAPEKRAKEGSPSAPATNPQSNVPNSEVARSLNEILNSLLSEDEKTALEALTSHFKRL
ncbi:hypothetical protein GCK72_019429 [Caenorhabditis remanei]|uniref:Uncharacterized protein n=1 Tax=Caenorhabditis remanei TaxID=31234 RepID=A0A6A5GDR8_CAERE|nr:hypothetical protein GCK72_019429 [Caenorhabditis remanei]KAF1752874.1 hypothetical protein GCK72_019429 [Caenorhabditis remanei]